MQSLSSCSNRFR